MGRPVDLEVIAPDAIDAVAPVEPTLPHGTRHDRRVTVAAGVALTALLAVIGAAALLRSHSGPRPPTKTECQLVPARQLARILGTSRVSAALDSSGFCHWTATPPGPTAQLQVQVYDAPDEALTAFGNEQALNSDEQTWDFGVAAFTAAHDGSAMAAAVVGDATIIAGTDGLADQSAATAAARAIVSAAADQVRRGWLPHTSTEPLP
jgi:hypothetical protein